MYTECPSCHTYFKITPEQLKAAEGKVRCGTCDHVFNALTNLAEKVPSKKPENEVAAGQESSVVEEATESIAAFQVDDPESEAALSEFSLPIDSDIGGKSEVVKAGDSEKIELALESMADLSAVAEESAASGGLENISLGVKSGADISQITSQFDEPVSAAEEPIKEDLSSFSALVSEIDELESGAASDVEKLEKASELKSRLSKFIIEEEEKIKSEMGTSSFADVDVPGVNHETESVENAPDELDDINKDIDDALDNLFDEESEAKHSAIEQDPLLDEATISDIDNISDLEDVKSHSIEKESKQNHESDFSDLDLNEEFGDSAPATRKTNKEHPPTDASEFSLGDSFLSSEPLEMQNEEWETLNKSANQTETYSKDNFKLEELEEEKPQASGGVSRSIWVVLIVMLLVVLLGQFAYLKREELAKYPSMRPILEQACAVIGCEVPDPQDLQAIVILDRNVVTHPNAKNALLITSTINNEAQFVQQFPELVLTFSDINQKVLARRSFSPPEYLVKGVDIAAGMQPQTPIKIMLEIVDPGEDAVNFEFDFR